MNLRFRIAICLSVVVSLIIFLSCFSLLTFLREKRVNDMATHTRNLTKQIISYQKVSDYLIELPEALSKDDVETFIHSIIKDNPFIGEMTFIDQYGKMPLQVIDNQDIEKTAAIPRAALSLHEILASGRPSLNKESWEYFLPISVQDQKNWGVVRVRWRAQATWQYFHVLKTAILYITLGTFALIFLLTYFVFLQIYSREYTRIGRFIQKITYGDYSQRIDMKAFSSGTSELIGHVNRLFAVVEDEKKKNLVLNDTLRQLERNCSGYLKGIHNKDEEIETVRKEMREGVITLFEMLWCGVLIIDADYQIHYKNEKADMLLRFSKKEDSYIVDEVLRRVLNPMLRGGEVERIDNVCTWKRNTDTISCNVRSAPIPTSDPNDSLYFLILDHGKGYPRSFTSSDFSKHLLFDFILPELNNSNKDTQDLKYSGETLQKINKQLGALHSLERGSIAPATQIRLSSWLQENYIAEDLFSDHLMIDMKLSDVDINLYMPEDVLRLFIDTTFSIISYYMYNEQHFGHTTISFFTSLDANGLPVFSIIVPKCPRFLSSTLQSVFEQKSKLSLERTEEKQLDIEDLLHDVNISIFWLLINVLKIRVEYVYTESKKKSTIRFIIANSSFLKQRKQKDTKNSRDDDVNDLLKMYLANKT